MTSSSSVQNGQLTRDNWALVAPYVVPPVAAAAAIVPVFYGFVAKSAQQVGKPIPRMSVIEVLRGGVKAAPTIGTIVGTQIIAQQVIENALKSRQNQQPTNFVSMLASSMIVGTVSAPLLAVFNGQTMGRSVLESLKALSIKQTGAIVTRETSFLFSLRVSEPMGEAMKATLGDSKKVEYGSTFVTGAFGSVVGHPADSVLTFVQKEIKIENARQLMRGAPTKAVAVGGFAVCYKFMKEMLYQLSNSQS